MHMLPINKCGQADINIPWLGFESCDDGWGVGGERGGKRVNELQLRPIKMSELRLRCAERRRFKSRLNILIFISIVPIVITFFSVILCIIKVQPM